jgi:DNA-binding Lrp family transcriptional regulator
MDLRQIDLNLLVVFNQLLVDRSVSLTADKLGLSQPAVSNALKRLRDLLKDDLFVRTSRGMEPDFVAWEAPARYLVGYGLDVDERHRELPYIAAYGDFAGS